MLFFNEITSIFELTKRLEKKMINNRKNKKVLAFKKNIINTYRAVYSGGVKYPIVGVQAISLLQQLYELYVGVVEVRNHEIGGVRLSTIEIPISKVVGESKVYLELLSLNMKLSPGSPFLISDDSEVICLTWDHRDFDCAELFLARHLRRLDYVKGIAQGNISLLEDFRVRNCVERIIRAVGFPKALTICSESLSTGILILEFTLSPVGDGRRSQYMRTKAKEALDGHCKECSILKKRGVPSFRMVVHF
jgi:hypothetical protein